MHQRVRRIAVALGIALAVLPFVPRAAEAAVTFGAVSPTSVAEAADYAAERFGDRWDYENADDQRLDSKAGMLNVGNQRMDGGRLLFTTQSGAAFDPVLTWPGDIPWGRDGSLHPIDAARYTRLAFSMKSSAAGTAVIMWFNCPTRTPQCQGANTQLAIKTGWNFYDLLLSSNDPNAPLPWSGQLTSLRIIPAVPASTAIEVDWMRLYRAGAPVAVQWQDSNPGNRVDVFYDTDTNLTNNTPDNPGWGLVESKNSASSNTTNFNAPAFPPGTYRLYAVDSGTTSAYSEPIVIDARPTPVIDNPDIAGGSDFATVVRGNAWDFDQTSDTSGVRNATNVSFSNSTLHATNTNNDPQVELPLAGNIDGTRFHRLSFVYSYDGAFGLEDAPGGGTMARIIWQVVGGGPNNYQDLNDLVTYQGVNRITVDLAANPPTAILDEDQVGARIGWINQQISTLRFDPNEDPGNRTWHLDDIRIAEDDIAGGTFDIGFHDTSWEQGTTADIFVDSDAGGFDGTPVATNVPVVQGVNTYRWSPSGLSAGTYFIHVALKDPRGTVAGAYSTGPVRVSAVSRLSGADRIATSIAIADASFPGAGSAGAVVLARHDNFPDALAGTPLARAKNGPLLLTQPTSLDPRVEATIKRVLPAGGTVYLLGSEGALSAGVDAQVRALGYTTVRYGGADRYETAVKIAEGVGSPNDLFLTTGTNYPDALSAGAAAGKVGGAVLLTNGSSMPPSTSAYLGSRSGAKRWAVGTPAQQADPSATALSGANRYETSRLVAQQFFPQPTIAAIASGTNFPDALSGGAHAAKVGAPLLLTPPEGLAAPISNYLTANRSTLSSGVVFGGETAVSENVRRQVEAAIA